ncbi:hypothetical protein NDU88_005530 [Pleurodeles waltl]|uniref:Uncharacterized protein n=1 Tax=Pleurodeles waltl TaxID=8319 RepID=A0AAV7PIU3_PLEWA|nr:hypothetical protein NDU88_005530 [Pleurodeles waltl]
MCPGGTIEMKEGAGVLQVVPPRRGRPSRDALGAQAGIQSGSLGSMQLSRRRKTGTYCSVALGRQPRARPPEVTEGAALSSPLRKNRRVLGGRLLVQPAPEDTGGCSREK